MGLVSYGLKRKFCVTQINTIIFLFCHHFILKELAHNLISDHRQITVHTLLSSNVKATIVNKTYNKLHKRHETVHFLALPMRHENHKKVHENTRSVTSSRQDVAHTGLPSIKILT